MEINDNILKNIIKQHEGKRTYVYFDTLEVATIGIGRNISESGIGLRDSEIEFMFNNDIEYCTNELEKHHFYNIQDEVRKGVLIELVFNLGIKGLLKFVHMISAFEMKEYETASNELLNSKWSKQVSKSRVNNILKRLSTGEY